MKKSVVILIAIIYVASIALVSFFGLQFKVFDEIVYSEGIEVLNIEREGLKFSETWGHYAVVDIAKNDKYVIEARLTPETTTNKKIIYEATPSVDGLATIDENGVVTFHDVGQVGFVTVTMTPADGGDFTAKLTILVTNTGTAN